jgi:hypothetical protein
MSMAFKTRPSWQAVSVVVAGMALTGCGHGHLASSATTSPAAATSPAPVRGVVTGVATPCHPQASTIAELAGIPVVVTLGSGGRSVATQTVTGRHIYRFVVAPGAYSVSSSAAGTSPQSADVDAGEVLRVDLLSDCI